VENGGILSSDPKKAEYLFSDDASSTDTHRYYQQ